MRLTATSFRYTLYSDASYTTVIGTQTQTVASSVDNLRYLKFTRRAGDGMTSHVDDLRFWNARTAACP